MVPKRLIIHDFRYLLEGGTIILRAIDDAGQQREVMLVQHLSPERSPSLNASPGRLYFDGELIPMRSQLETAILALLRAAEVRYSATTIDISQRIQLQQNALIIGNDIREVLSREPEQNIQALITKLLEFVASHYFRVRG